MVAMGKSNWSNPLDIPTYLPHKSGVFKRLSEFSAPEISYRTANYMKFTFVRHPFERLLSAYRNKFQLNDSDSVGYFRDRYGKHIVQTYRSHPSNESLERGDDVTFQEFVQYIIDPKTTEGAVYNEHWTPMSELCQPCKIDYDIVGKYETLNDDAWLVLDRANLSRLVQFPQSETVLATGKLVDHYLQNLTDRQLFSLYRVYESDFKLFDFQFEPAKWAAARGESLTGQ